jgi:N-acetyl-gamma-glutamyl-phosphate reductase
MTAPVSRRVAIAGERGLVSRALQHKLAKLPGIVLSVVPTEEASTVEGAQRLAQADLVVLAVQDFASPAIVALLPESARVLDVSPAFRTDRAWVYGLPELPGQAARIAAAQRVANPGCFATSAILLLAPLVRAGLLAPEAALYLDAVGGYSTGGAALESRALAGELAAETVYSLAREHRHVPEIRQFSQVTGPLWFMPKIANFPRGIRMQVPLPGLGRKEVLAAYWDAYAGSAIMVDDTTPSKLTADEWAHRAGACLRVLPQAQGCLAICSLDNLGKGAVDSAYGNLCLMLGLPGA